MKINTAVQNAFTPDLFSSIAQWHHDRNLIEGASDVAQFTKLIEEAMELRMTIEPGITPDEAIDSVKGVLEDIRAKGKLRVAESGQSPADDIGDMNVVLTNIAERHELSMESCLKQAYEDIKDRKGRMIDGMFVKEADLHLYE